jgi:hypothetical protein
MTTSRAAVRLRRLRGNNASSTPCWRSTP